MGIILELGKELLMIAIGSFVGFGFAIYADNKIDQANEKKRIIRVKNSVNDELMYIMRDLRGDSTFFLTTPIWNSVISSGDLIRLLATDKKVYNSIMEIYQGLQSLEYINNAEKKKEREMIIAGLIEDLLKEQKS